MGTQASAKQMPLFLATFQQQLRTMTEILDSCCYSQCSSFLFLFLTYQIYFAVFSNQLCCSLTITVECCHVSTLHLWNEKFLWRGSQVSMRAQETKQNKTIWNVDREGKAQKANPYFWDSETHRLHKVRLSPCYLGAFNTGACTQSKKARLLKQAIVKKHAKLSVETSLYILELVANSYIHKTQKAFKCSPPPHVTIEL